MSIFSNHHGCLLNMYVYNYIYILFFIIIILFFCTPTAARGRSGVLGAQPEVVHAHCLRNSPGGAPTVARGRSGVLRAQPEVVNAHGLRH